MKIRLKMTCQSVTRKLKQHLEGHEPEFTYDAEFSCAYGGSEENKQFFAWTPSGTLRFQALNADRFMPGQDYYLDLEPVSPIAVPA